MNRRYCSQPESRRSAPASARRPAGTLVTLRRAYLAFLMILLVSVVQFVNTVSASEDDMRIDQIRGELSDQIDELYASGTMLYMAILGRARARLLRWQIGSPDSAAPIHELEPLGSIEALHGSGSMLWIGNREGKIFRWQPGRPPDQRPGVDGNVQALFWDGSVLWIGTRQGLFQSHGDLPPTRVTGFSESVRSIFGNESKLWIGTEQGLYTWNKYASSAPSRFPLSLMLDRKSITAVYVVNEKVWIGTQAEGGGRNEYGLYRWQDGRLESVMFRRTTVWSLFGDGSTLWIGSSLGLFQIKGTSGKWDAQLEVKTRLPSSVRPGDSIPIKWVIGNYEGRTSQSLVDQHVIVYDHDKEVRNLTVPKGAMQLVLDPIEKAGDYTLVVQARDLNGEIARSKAISLTVASFVGANSWIIDATKIWIGHVFFWGLLIFAYPKYSKVQAIFFWNSWARRIIGLGYVGFALTWVPYLRAKLFVPFRESLVADAALDSFRGLPYFDESEVENAATGEVGSIKEAIPEIKGQTLLEGESGLGKSMYLRRLVKQSKRLVVFLPADKCGKGVIEAVQNKLQGLAKDENFLRSLIFSGAFDICIDGLNEVTADTRAKICDFAESNFKGNIIMSTQPMECRPPSTSRTYIIQPLTRVQIQEFLDLLGENLPQDAKLTRPEYQQACSRFLSEVLSETQPKESLASAQRILSNPMDLSVIADILARGKTPDLFRLLEQQYNLMAADYQRRNLNSKFPLLRFSESVYKMKLDDVVFLGAANWPAELECMSRHKMIIERPSSRGPGNPTNAWRFRHDKIMEFFVVQTFLGEKNERPALHLGDPRFNGVYFLLAMLMPLEDARALRECLIQYAADTKDHTVSDTFVQLLRARAAV